MNSLTLFFVKYFSFTPSTPSKSENFISVYRRFVNELTNKYFLKLIFLHLTPCK